MTGFGPHLIYDGYGCPAARLEDLQGLYRLLDELPDRIRMTKIMPPYVFRHGVRDGSQGLSGFVLIAESHISVHTFPARKFVNVDVFSCNAIDVEETLNSLRDCFTAKRVDWKLLDRGLEFPKNIGETRAIVTRDRRLVASRAMGLGSLR